MSENDIIYCIICTEIIDDETEDDFNASSVCNSFPYVYR